MKNNLFAFIALYIYCSFFCWNKLYCSNNDLESKINESIQKIDGKYNYGQDLDKFGDEASIYLIKYIDKNPNDYLRCVIISKKLGKDKKYKAIPVIMKFINTNFLVSDVAEEVDLILSPFGKKVIPYIIKLLDSKEIRNAKEDKTRLRSIQTFQKIPDKRAIKILLTYLNDNSKFVGYASCIALGNIKNKSVTDDLLNILNSKLDTLVKIGSAHALGLLGRDDGFKLCKSIIENKKHVWRGAAIIAIGNIEHPHRMELIMSCLQDDWDMVGRYAVEVLEKIGTQNEIPALQELLKNVKEPWQKTKIEQGIENILKRTKSK